MEPINSTEEAYDRLVDPDKGHWVENLLAFAIFEQGRMDWIAHHRAIAGTNPTSGEIQAWYRQQPESAIARASDSAHIALLDIATAAAQKAIDNEKLNVLQEAVVAEVRSQGRLRRQLFLGIISGMMSAVLFSALLILLAAITASDPSPLQVFHLWNRSHQGVGDGAN